MSEHQVSCRLPGPTLCDHASKIAIVEDRPIMLDYWPLSLEGKIIIGIREDGEKLLVKSQDEYTSPITQIFKVKEEGTEHVDYIVLTENSLYLVNSACQARKIA